MKCFKQSSYIHTLTKNNIFLDSTPSLEPCPKWETLSEILAEISEEEETCTEVEDPSSANDESNNPEKGNTNINGEDVLLKPSNHVLICAEDDRTCNQLREVSG